MRTIKFRAKSKKSGKWLFGFYLQNRGSHFICPDEFANGKSWDDYEVIPDTIGQFTGLKDNKGKEVYEGDIVMFWGRPASIEINQIGYAVRPSRISYPIHLDKEGGEVIGNTYDNPEFMEGGAE